MNSEKPKLPAVCFYGLYTYPVFNPEFSGAFGGWEIRMTMIARELARRGLFDVTVIVADYGQPHIEYIDGVRLLSWTGKPGLNMTPNKSTQIAVSQEEAPQPYQKPKKTPLPPLKKPLQDGSVVSKVAMSGRSFYHVIWKKIGRRFISVSAKKAIGHLVRGWYANFKGLVMGSLSLLRAIAGLLLALARISWQATKRTFVVVKEAVGVAQRFYSSLDADGHFVIWKDDVDILLEADAEIYVVFGNHYMAAVVANYCSKTEKKYIFSAGSEYDYYPEYASAPYERDIYGTPYFEKNYAIMNATLHIVQTPKQAQMLREGFGRDGVVVRNPIDLSSLALRDANPAYILWVGKSDERVKRPSLVLELAHRMPQTPFVIVMNRSIPETYDLQEARAKTLPNVTLIESVPYGEIEDLFASARLFVNTSVFEGFPNTFLQAAKYGVPVVATDIDPGEMLTVHQAGLTCGGDFERFAENVRRLMDDQALYSELSANALRYVRENHEKGVVITQYADALKSLLA